MMIRRQGAWGRRQYVWWPYLCVAPQQGKAYMLHCFAAVCRQAAHVAGTR
jgi:hypothetical protein